MLAPESLLSALRHVWLALQSRNIPVALMGGLALATWKHVRATRDIDLLIGASEDDPDRLLEALRPFGIRPKRFPPTVSLGRIEVLQLVYEPPETFVDIQIDLLLARSDYHRQALGRSVPTRIPSLDLEIAVLSCEDMILHKLLAERIIDLADVAALLVANRRSLDIAYLAEWIEKLGLWQPFRQAWQAALPDEPVPGPVA